MELKIFEGFAGYGGGSFALKRIKKLYPNFEYNVIGYSENDKYASELFDLNHKDTNNNLIKNYGDITKINPQDLPDFDMFIAGFPCQPFSTIGLQLGTDDKYGRGNMLNYIIKIITVKKPKYLFLENVKGFTNKKFKPIHYQLIKDLTELGYGENPLHKTILNSKDYGIPQNRERLFMFAQLGGLPSTFSLVPPKIETNLRLKDLLDNNPDKSLYLSDEQINRLKERTNINTFNVPTPLCFDIYNKKIKTDGYCITILQPHHCNLRLIEPPKNNKEIIRRLSIYEQYRLMGFDISKDLKQSEIIFPNQSYTQLCNRVGNGWDINLITLLFIHIFKQINLL